MRGKERKVRDCSLRLVLDLYTGGRERDRNAQQKKLLTHNSHYTKLEVVPQTNYRTLATTMGIYLSGWRVVEVIGD